MSSVAVVSLPVDTSKGLAAKSITSALAELSAATPLTKLMSTAMSRPTAVMPGTPTMATSSSEACSAIQLRGLVKAFS